ncbi:MAG: hypothetical protein F6J97_16450 [Leptolyngbya sp. SIO4C1]|nr:hypothetical protein [Leptolyngbya sp. SIO4C1]
MSLLSKINSPLLKLGSAALLAVTLLPACAEDAATPREESNASLEEVSDETAQLIGETVSIRGKVEEAVDESSILMEEDNLFGGDQVLVINVSEQPLVLPEGEGQEVQATGEVIQFTLADIETEYGLDLDPELYADYEDQAVVLAQSLALAPDPSDISADPSQFYNQPISVEGNIDDVLAGDVFVIDGEEIIGQDDLLVVSRFEVPSLTDDSGQPVVVTGTLRPYVAADFERDYDLTWDLDFQQQIEAEYSEQPVFVAEDVYLSAM